MTEFLKRDFSIEIRVGLDDGSVDQLLQLSVIEVVSHHHFQDGEELTVRNEPVIVDVVNLKSKFEFFLLRGAGGHRVQSLNKLQE